MKSYSFNANKLWTRYPAFFYGLAYLLGYYSILSKSWTCFIPIVLILSLTLIEKNFKRCCLFAVMFFSSAIYITTTIKHPSNCPLEGKGIFEISHLKFKNTPSQSWLYIGHLKKFETSDGQYFYNIPCSLNLPIKQDLNRPLANQSYLIAGNLKKSPSGHFSIYTDPAKPWHPIPWTFSLAEYRYRCKKKFSDYLAIYYSDSRVRNFLKGLSTGEFSDKTLGFQLSRFGLQHIMAISGFHFALVAGIFHFMFTAFSKQLSHYFLLASLTFYFIFLGCSPSIMRAWISIMVFIIGSIVEKKGTALNNLGLSLLIILILYPEMGSQIGFQMSFLATGAILLLFPILDGFFDRVFRTRPLAAMVQMNHLNQWAYCILIVFRKSFSLSVSVLILTLPLSLFYFKKFPLLSIFYNLFFPFLTSLSMTFLIFGLFISLFIPGLGALLHDLNQSFTAFLLNFAYNIPRSFDIYLEGSISTTALVCCLSFTLMFALLYHNKERVAAPLNPNFL